MIHVNPQMLSDLGSRRWLMPVMACFHANSALRFAQLRQTLSIGSESLSKTLDYLVKIGWLERNEGHGHPLRPEYLLASEGRTAANCAHSLSQSLQKLKIDSSRLTRWSYPVLALMHKGHSRFSEFENILDKATSRAIAQCLKRLVELEVATRHVGEEYPPSPKYTLTQRGQILVKSLTVI